MWCRDVKQRKQKTNYAHYFFKAWFLAPRKADSRHHFSPWFLCRLVFHPSCFCSFFFFSCRCNLYPEETLLCKFNVQVWLQSVMLMMPESDAVLKELLFTRFRPDHACNNRHNMCPELLYLHCCEATATFCSSQEYFSQKNRYTAPPAVLYCNRL